MLYFYSILEIFILTFIYLFVFLPFTLKRQKNPWISSVFYIYISAVFYLTLTPFSLPTSMINISALNINLVPLADILAFHKHAFREFALNILLTAPFGFFLHYLYRRGFFQTVYMTLSLSLSIEILQLFCTNYVRRFDTTDLISNTLGGALGFALFSLANPLIQKVLHNIGFSDPSFFLNPKIRLPFNRYGKIAFVMLLQWCIRSSVLRLL